MKKSVAIGAAVATTLGTTIASATGAQAVPLTDCATSAEYAVSGTSSASDATHNWVSGCLPQFGFGKAEFTLSSDVDFPADFKPLTDPSVTLSVDYASASAQAYMAPELGGRTINEWLRYGLTRTDAGTNPRSQAYSLGTNNSAVFPFPIHSITRVSTATVTAAAGCNNPDYPYTDAFIIDYDPVNITVTEQAGGETWTTTVTADPDSVQVGFVVDGSGNLATANSSLCILRGPQVYASRDQGQFAPAVTSIVMYVTPYPAVDGPQNGALGNFEFVHGKRALANTGLDDVNRWAWLTAGLAMVVAGGVAVGARRRRKRSR